MRIGTIVKNFGSGYETYFVYTGEKAYRGKGSLRGITEGYTLRKDREGWHVQRDCYAVADLEDADRFPRVGYIDLEQVLTRGILKAIGINE